MGQVLGKDLLCSKFKCFNSVILNIIINKTIVVDEITKGEIRREDKMLIQTIFVESSKEEFFL